MPFLEGNVEYLEDWCQEVGARPNFDPEKAFRPITPAPDRGILAPLPGCDSDPERGILAPLPGQYLPSPDQDTPPTEPSSEKE